MLDGAVGHRISISVDDPRRVEVVVEFPSLELARRYEELLLLPHIRDDDRKAGVVEHGAVWIAMLWERRRYPSQVAGHDA